MQAQTAHWLCTDSERTAPKPQLSRILPHNDTKVTQVCAWPEFHELPLFLFRNQNRLLQSLAHTRSWTKHGSSIDVQSQLRIGKAKYSDGQASQHSQLEERLQNHSSHSNILLGQGKGRKSESELKCPDAGRLSQGGLCASAFQLLRRNVRCAEETLLYPHISTTLARSVLLLTDGRELCPCHCTLRKIFLSQTWNQILLSDTGHKLHFVKYLLRHTTGGSRLLLIAKYVRGRQRRRLLK